MSDETRSPREIEQEGHPAPGPGSGSRGTPAPAGPGGGTAPPARRPVAALSAPELRLALVRPDRLVECVLGSADRMARNLSERQALGLLTCVLAVASLPGAVPFGAVAPAQSAWDVAALYTGSMLICFPCLYTFLQFLGFRISIPQNLSVGLVITATAGLFTLGFAPIIWFIDVTAGAGFRGVVTPAGLMRFLLAVALALGIGQMIRCLSAREGAWGESRGLLGIVLLWLPLLLFIMWRMADVLGLRG